MTPRTKEKIVQIIDFAILVCVGVIVLLWFGYAEASGDCRDGSCNANNDNDVIIKDIAPHALGGAANVAVDGGRHESLGIGWANALGDAIIGDCVVTTQLGIVVFNLQGFDENPWCMSLWYDANGMHEMAARMRCRTDNVRKEFTEKRKFDKKDCIEANTKVSRGTLTESNSQLEAQLKELAENFNSIRQIKVGLEASLNAQNERIANLEEVSAKAAERRREAPARPQTIIQQQPFLSEDKRTKLAAIRGDE